MIKNDPMEKWNPLMVELLGKEKWDSLNYWQKMCEVCSVQEYRQDHPMSIFGFKL